MITIYMHPYGELHVDEALSKMTDEWIEGGNICDQTVFDMRDALRELYGVTEEM